MLALRLMVMLVLMGWWRGGRGGDDYDNEVDYEDGEVAVDKGPGDGWLIPVKTLTGIYSLLLHCLGSALCINLCTDANANLLLCISLAHEQHKELRGGRAKA